MRGVLIWLGYTVLAILLVLAAVFAFYRLRGPSGAQREALALMQRDYRPTHGVNAFARLLYMDYDVDDAALDATLANDIAAIRTRVAAGKFVADYQPEVPKLAEIGGDVSRLCAGDAGSCLARVAADPAAMRTTLATYPTLLAREAGFERSDHDWNPLQSDVETSLHASASTAQRVWLSAMALRYVDGQREQALADVCRNMSAWRRVRAGANSLLTSMLGIAYADGGMRLFAAMLAQTPTATSVPTECSDALRPVDADDVDRCAELAGNFAFLVSSVGRSASSNRQPNGWDRAFAWLTFDATQSAAWLAEPHAAHCGDAADRRMLADTPLRSDDFPQPLHRLECIASVNGCVLASITVPAYDGYDEHVLDFAAHLRLAAALLWLRDPVNGGAAQSTAARYAQRPASLRSGRRESGYDAARAVVFVQNLGGRRESRFELPVAVAH